MRFNSGFKGLISSCLSVHLPIHKFSLFQWNNPTPTGRPFKKHDIRGFVENLLRKFRLDYHLTRITDTLHEDLCTFMIISRYVLRRLRNISDTMCRENQNKYLFKNVFFFEIRAVYEIRYVIWKNMVEPDRPQTCYKFNGSHPDVSRNYQNRVVSVKHNLI